MLTIEIRDILECIKTTRDDDLLLFTEVMKRLGYSLDLISASALLELWARNEAPKYGTVVSARRTIQRTEPSLRGHSHKRRQELSQEWKNNQKEKRGVLKYR